MSWMAWTAQTAIFFTCIGIALAVMTVIEVLRPTEIARGFLPMATTRGDRFFISLLSAAFIHLFWLGAIGENLVIASALSAIWAALLMRWG
jgi:predicted small integral membrane protein